jgi:hypothetical protein
MRNSKPTPNNAFRDALLNLQAKGNEKARSLIIGVKASVEARQERIETLKSLVYQARIPNLEAGYRNARALGYMGGEDYEEALRVLKFARASKEDWQTALVCFNQ